MIRKLALALCLTLFTSSWAQGLDLWQRNAVYPARQSISELDNAGLEVSHVEMAPQLKYTPTGIDESQYQNAQTVPISITSQAVSEEKPNSRLFSIFRFKSKTKPQQQQQQLQLVAGGYPNVFENSGYFELQSPYNPVNQTSVTKESKTRLSSYLPWKWIFTSATPSSSSSTNQQPSVGNIILTEQQPQLQQQQSEHQSRRGWLPEQSSSHIPIITNRPTTCRCWTQPQPQQSQQQQQQQSMYPSSQIYESTNLNDENSNTLIGNMPESMETNPIPKYVQQPTTQQTQESIVPQVPSPMVTTYTISGGQQMAPMSSQASMMMSGPAPQYTSSNGNGGGAISQPQTYSSQQQQQPQISNANYQQQPSPSSSSSSPSSSSLSSQNGGNEPQTSTNQGNV